MKTLELRKATGSLARYIGDAQKGPVVFTVKGDPIAALVPVTNADLETLSLSSNQTFLGLIRRSRRAWETEGGLSTAQVRLRLSRPVKKRHRRKP
jgi:antitoxin (DNA-binding transcriptional repressor) of toxin-antitoxin stability system